MIVRPTSSVGHPERLLECEFAMEEEFLALANRANAAGWICEEVAETLLSLAQYYQLACNAEAAAAPPPPARSRPRLVVSTSGPRPEKHSADRNLPPMLLPVSC